MCHLVKKGHIWDWGSEQQATFEKARILMRQIKALGIPQTGIPFELDVSRTPEVGVRDCGRDNKGETAHRILVPARERDKT